MADVVAKEVPCKSVPDTKKDRVSHHWERAHDRTLDYTCTYCQATCTRDYDGNTVAFAEKERN